MASGKSNRKELSIHTRGSAGASTFYLATALVTRGLSIGFRSKLTHEVSTADKGSQTLQYL